MSATDAPVATKRSDWRRHDIVYSPEFRMYGTVSETDINRDSLVEWSDGSKGWYSVERLDEWQRVNDERGKP